MNEQNLNLFHQRKDDALTMLTDYVRGNLTTAEQWEFEEAMHHDKAISDAFEGLQQMNDLDELYSIERTLNKSISKTVIKNHRRLFKPLKFPMWIVLLASFVLLTVLAGYAIIAMMN
jgi:anti-sigma-K factor RskA